MTSSDQECLSMEWNKRNLLTKQNNSYSELCEEFNKLKLHYGANKKSLTHKHLNLICERFLRSGFVYFMKFQCMLLTMVIPEENEECYKPKLFSLMIYFFGPMVYNFLKKFLYLPSPEHVKSFSKTWVFDSVLNPSLFQILSVKARLLKPRSKECVLTVGKMSLKSFLVYNAQRDKIVGVDNADVCKNSNCIAKFVVVLMIHGLHDSWKQLVGYIFVDAVCPKNNLQNVIFDYVEELFRISFDIKVVISDLNGIFDTFELRKTITPHNPYFSIGCKEIVFMYDSFRLINETRNHFFRYRFQSRNKIADKAYLKTFYNRDVDHKLAPKLTGIHMEPNMFEKNQIKYAAETFSNTVAIEMTLMVHRKELSRKSFHTINFIESMNNLFDIFNSNAKSSNVPKKVKSLYRVPFTNINDQKKFLMSMFDYFQYLDIFQFNAKRKMWMKVVATSHKQFVNAWLITIAGLFRLHTNLSYEYESRAKLPTYRLNHECWENYFQIAESENRRPSITCNRFEYLFKQAFCSSYFENLEGVNRLNDLDDILNMVNTYNTGDMELIFPRENQNEINLFISNIDDYKRIRLPRKKALIFFCSYLMGHCLQMHTCKTCLNFARASTNLSCEYFHLYYKAYEKNPSHLLGDSIKQDSRFFEYVAQLDNVFNQHFAGLIKTANVGKTIRTTLLKFTSFQHPCAQFPQRFLVNLFLQSRIYIALRKTNKKYRASYSNKTKGPRVKIITNI